MFSESFNRNVVVYSTDVNPNHCGTIIYKDEDGNLSALRIDENPETENVWFFSVSSFYTEVESWMDITSLNKSCDSDHQPGPLTREQSISLTSDVISYWGTQNQESVMDEADLINLLKARNILI